MQSNKLSSLIDDFETQDSVAPREDNKLSSLIDDAENEKASQLKANVSASTSISPEAATKQYQIFQQTKIPVNIVRTQENQIKQMTELNSINYQDILNKYPLTAKQLADPNKVAAIRDDVDSLSYFEKVFGSVKQEYKTAKENVAQADLLVKQMNYDVTGNEKFKLTPLEENSLALIEESQAQNKDYKLGFVSSIPSYTAAAIPTILSTIPETLGGAAVGAAAGGAITKTPAGAIAGATLGSRAGTAYGAGKLEMGLAYKDLKNLVDETGKPIEKEVAAGAAIATGAVNGLIELIPFEAATGQIKKAFSREGVKAAAKTKVGREYLKNIGQLAAAEGLAEGSQELMNVLFTEAAKVASTGDFGIVGMKDANDTEGLYKFLSEAGSRIAESAKAGAGGGAGLGAATGGVTAAKQVYDQRNQGKQESDEISKTVEKIKESKIFKRDPELFKETTQDTLGEQNVYIPAEQVQTFFQTKTPEEVEQFYQAVPEARAQLSEALESGGNLVLPANQILTAIAQNQSFAELQKHMSFTPESLSEQAAQDTFLSNVSDTVNFEQKNQKEAVGQEAVKNNIKNQILGLNLPKNEAQNVITALTSYYDTKSSRYGSPEAKKVLDSYLGNLEVKNAVFNRLQPMVKNTKVDELDKFINQARKFNPKKPTKPLLKFLKEKGGVRMDSNLAGELNALGITTKTAPGLFRKESGLGDVDNFPASEFIEKFPNSGAEIEGDYISRQAVLDLIGRELQGVDISREISPDEERLHQFLEDLDRLGVDIKNSDNETVKKAIESFSNQQNIETAIEEPNTSKLSVEELEKPQPEFNPETKPELIEPEKPIEDFGEKIVGAKKDLFKTYEKSIKEALPEDSKDITLAKYFPEPNYESMIADGVDVKVLAAVKAIRDLIPNKPRTPFKLKRWVDNFKGARSLADDLISGDLNLDKFITESKGIGGGNKFHEAIKLYAELGYPAFLNAKDWSVRQSLVSMYRGIEYDPMKLLFMVSKGRYDFGVPFENYDDAVDALRNKLSIKPTPEARVTKLDIYQNTRTREIFIGKKVAAGKFIDLRKGFTSMKEARTFLKENEQSLLELLAKRKETRPTRKAANEERVGKDYRMGENTTPEKFASEFGFRGVQFGNYVEQAKRANDLNNSYDALLDLSNILNVPSRALSLNGELGIAFGARGTGGKDAASAHYEPNNIVINLTKNKGAGSLGHEWWHALDNFFGKQIGKDFLTKNKETYNANLPIRKEVIDAYKDLMKAITASDLPNRSKKLDVTKSKDYWSTLEEMSARSFETYLISKAKEKGYSNDYLANVLDEKVSNVNNEMNKDLGLEEEPYAYPTEKEAPQINAAFDNLFNTLKTKETEKGITFFQTSQDQTKTEAFKKWFGDSKVVDKNGEPLVVYHGTNRPDFEEFSPNGNFGFEPAIYFSSKKKLAEQYLGNKGEGKIFETYLSIQNPVIIDAQGASFNDIYVQLLSEISSAKNNEHDGLIIKNLDDSRLQTKKSKVIADVYVVFDSKQIKSVENKGTFDPENPNIYYQTAPTFYSALEKQITDLPQGQTQFIGQKPIISLFKSKNRSTLLHELGHVFLQIESEVAKLPDISEQVKKDWKTIEEWLDIKDGKITTEQHEKFARGFEAYLREGRAPSIGLRNAFRKFKSWLLKIYKNVKALDVEISEPVRKVFDRMLATDEEIENLKSNPLFRADQAILDSLSEEEQKKYLALTQSAKESAKEKLLSKSLKELAKQNTKSYKEEKAKVRAELEKQLNETPVYRALNILKSPDYKLSRASVENYDGDFIKRLPKDIIAEDGVDVDMAADYLGFKDGGEMLNSLAEAPSFKTELKNAVDEEMAARYVEPINEEEAINASENDARAKKILYELNNANKKVHTFVDTVENYKQKAKDILAKKEIKDATQSNIYYLNEVKAAREAGIAYGAKDYTKAVEWKKKQLLNHYLYRESQQIKKDVKDFLKRAERYKRKPVVGKVSIDEDYRERIVGLLQDFGVDAKGFDYEKTNIAALENWKKEQADEGVLGLVNFSEMAEFQDKDNIRSLTTDQFKTLDNAVTNLAHVGQGLRSLEIEGKRVELDAIANDIVNLVNQNIKKDKPSLEDPTTLEKLKRDFESYASSLIKTSQITLKIDGEKNLGDFYNYFEKNVNSSELKKEELKDQAYKKFDEIFKKHFGGYNLSKKRTHFKDIGRSFSKPATLVFALNWGNALNRRRVMDGFEYSTSQVNSILSSLTKNELEFVQDVWDMVNSYWPQVEATQKKLFGFAPKKQGAIPFTIKSSDGHLVKMKGGYYPIAYSKEASLVSDTKEDLQQLFAASAADKISFHASYTKERSEEKIDKKIELSLNPLTKHISQVITDIAMKESVWNSYKIINNRKVSAALIKKIGLADYKQLQTWLYDMYGKSLVQEGLLGKLAGLSRSVATTYAMGFKVATALIQITGLTNSIVKLGYGNVGSGIWKALGNGNPVSINKAAKLAFAKSKILEDRSKTINRDIYEVMDRLQQSGKMTKAIAKFAFLATTKAQMMVDLPTWYGGYYKGLKDFNGDDNKAVELADRLVIESQGSSYKQSRSSIERNEAAIVKAFTVFYNYMNVKLNLLVGSYRKSNFKKPKDVATFASDLMLLFFVDAVATEFLREGISNLLAGRDSEDDEEEIKTLHYANLIGQSLASTVPGASQFYSGLSGYSFNPGGFKGFEIVGKGVKNVGAEAVKAISEDEEADLLKTLRGLNDTLAVFSVGGGSQIDIFLRAEQEAQKGNDVAPIDYLLRPKK